MGKKSFVDFGRNLKILWENLFPTPFDQALEEIRPQKPPSSPAPPLKAGQPVIFPPGTQFTSAWPAKGDKMVVIQDDEALVKRAVVARMAEIAVDADWWTSRGLWTSGLGIPDAAATRRYIEQLEKEAEELRCGRDLGEPIEDLT